MRNKSLESLSWRQAAFFSQTCFELYRIVFLFLVYPYIFKFYDIENRVEIPFMRHGKPDVVRGILLPEMLITHKSKYIFLVLKQYNICTLFAFKIQKTPKFYSACTFTCCRSFLSSCVHIKCT